MNTRLLPTSECAHNQGQPLLSRICPMPACLEWRVAHWNGVKILFVFSYVTKILKLVFFFF